MKLYNTATKKVEPIAPLDAPAVTVYTCGPTVYDYLHIGNWFTLVRYDLLVRTLKLSDLEPNWVMNITDVGHLVSDADDGEDKLEKGARREGKTAWDVAKHYGDYFMEGMQRLNFTPPTHVPKATDHIPEQIELVKQLEEKGYTYIIDDGVYYDTSKFKDYGKLAQLDLDEQQAGARVAVNTQKRNQSDFALWKFSPQGQQRDMEWDSPWGKGFPGWHLECSAMARKYLGDTLDIHSGGIDHIPVHHTNEIAQSEAVTGKPLANIWMHTNHILVDGEKISKSLGNGITLEDVEAKGFTPMDLRLLILSSHYRTQSTFSWEALEAAHNRLVTLRAWADLRFQPVQGKESALGRFVSLRDDLVQELREDLRTPTALALLSEPVATILETGIHDVDVDKFIDLLSFIDAVLGLDLSSSEDVSESQRLLMSARAAARDAKDWVKSDELRDKLAEQGVAVRDTTYGQIWSRL